ncbi:hypothetical protein BDP27DRAFT_1364771 [Rhodocollybia butyracea]|uniref:Uncharacterized protein n=1 Tax=Rhodocollybia butyracea TaxID=206335 RepID=A0A9P5PL06_9AGAR|nr:hypothetical protein BDP27DRAFT_1364771 [Rhodocollybia butyracea]
MSLPKLSPAALSIRIRNIRLVHHQAIYNGRPNEDITAFIDSIERNSQLLNIPRVQWVDVALYFMAESVQKVMQKYKENILESDKTNDDNLWKDCTVHNAAQQSAPPFLVSDGDGEDPNSELFLRAAAEGVAVAGVTYAVGPAVVLAALNAVGFTSSGVLAGSVAAGVQSIVYGGSTGGLFSVMQCIGATGVVASAPVLGLAAGVAGLAALVFTLFKIVHVDHRTCKVPMRQSP